MPIRKVKGGYKWGSHGHVYKSRAGAERQARAAHANGFRGDGRSRLEAAKRRRLDVYGQRADAAYVSPPDHQAGMRKPAGGEFLCTYCEYLLEDGVTCGNRYFILADGRTWDDPKLPGTGELPRAADDWCCDWFEER